jgi:hypothetical protein
VLHASDVTQAEFCPRRWAFFDILKKEPSTMVVSAALDVTFQLGFVTEALIVEKWAGDHVVGNWRCRLCNESRSMTINPKGYCKTGKKHWWEYLQMRVQSEELGLEGGIDALFNIGAPQLVVTELKIMAPDEFEKIVAPLPEHRLRTNLYMKILAESAHPFKDKINVDEARVLYTSRGYGKMNAQWNEILPFKEFTVKRNDADLQEFLTRSKALKAFRTEGLMPSGICHTALDKVAKKCSVCPQCFSGQYPAGKPVQQQSVSACLSYVSL